jgi:hypothetical protein
MAVAQSLYLDGTSGTYCYLNNSNVLTIPGNFSFRWRMKLGSGVPGGSTHYVISKGLDASGDRFFEVWLDASEQIHVLVRDGASYDEIRWSVAVPVGAWRSYCVTVDMDQAPASTMILYDDGVAQGNGTVINGDDIASVTDGVGDLSIGDKSKSASGTFEIDAYFSEFSLHDDVLTPALVAQYNHQVLTSSTPGIQELWLFDGDLADTGSTGTYDLTGAGHVFSSDVPDVSLARPRAIVVPPGNGGIGFVL